MYSAGVMGSLALYHSADKYQLLRLLGNTVVLGHRNGPNAISCSPDGLFVAFVGPNEFTVSVVDSRTLDEVRLEACHCSTVLVKAARND